MVKPRRKGSVNLVITQAIAKVPTVEEDTRNIHVRRRLRHVEESKSKDALERTVGIFPNVLRDVCVAGELLHDVAELTTTSREWRQC